jgi:hypothetical protein
MIRIQKKSFRELWNYGIMYLQANYKAMGYELHRFIMLFAQRPKGSMQYWESTENIFESTKTFKDS